MTNFLGMLYNEITLKGSRRQAGESRMVRERQNAGGRQRPLAVSNEMRETFIVALAVAIEVSFCISGQRPGSGRSRTTLRPAGSMRHGIPHRAGRRKGFSRVRSPGSSGRIRCSRTVHQRRGEKKHRNGHRQKRERNTEKGWT